MVTASRSRTRTGARRGGWEPNLQRRRYRLAGENRRIRLRVSTKGMKTIDKRGIESVVAELRARGTRI